jgi:hypothetical protein
MVDATGDVVTAFRLMNYLYAAALALTLCLLMDHYAAPAAVKTVAILNVFASVAFAKFFTFYPVLVDLGALALLTLAVWLIVRGRSVAAAITCVLAVLAREFAVAALAFGVHHDLRTGRRWWTVAATYLPAAVAFLGLRWLVAQAWADREGGEMLTAERFATNLRLWEDPVFGAFFLYFLLTVAGGVSMFVCARIGPALPRLRREPEWVTFSGVILAAAVVGDADIWRYLAYLAPVLIVLFVWCADSVPVGGLWWMSTAALVSLATVVTQRPLQGMDVPSYFLDWFPYYIQKGNVPFEPIVSLWPVWAWRLLATAGLFWLLTIVPETRPRSIAAARPVV